jgi:hypothetical protein
MCVESPNEYEISFFDGDEHQADCLVRSKSPIPRIGEEIKVGTNTEYRVTNVSHELGSDRVMLTCVPADDVQTPLSATVLKQYLKRARGVTLL